MHHPTYRITHTTAFVTPVVEHWLEREIAQWVHSMKNRSDDPSHHEQISTCQRFRSATGGPRSAGRPSQSSGRWLHRSSPTRLSRSPAARWTTTWTEKGNSQYTKPIQTEWCTEKGNSQYTKPIQTEWCTENGNSQYTKPIQTEWCTENGNSQYTKPIQTEWGTVYLRLYGVGHMVKDQSDSERGNLLPPHRLLLPVSSKGSFI